MILMQEIVQEALKTGYLSAAAEDRMRSLIQNNYDSEDLDAWIILQRAVSAGEVKQESRRKKAAFSSQNKDTSSNIKLAYQIAAEIAYAAAIALSMSKNTKDQPPLGA
ncbi:MAG: hypothetical protein KME21_05820 [Desmonostoc vinosum HA7617-LM4]|jgi:hypothetical protein|nr:hypothetical protein [Desmonostoc vinosum HA7617-LM4]